MRPRTIALRYGQGLIEVALPAGADILDAQEPASTVNYTHFRQGIARLLAGADLTQAIAVVVADKTRLCGYTTVLPRLLDVLAGQGVCKEQITFYIAYGTHARQSEAECLAAYGEVYHTYPFIHHDSNDQAAFACLGTTRRGTPVHVRRDVVSAGTIITAGAISHHYFAGFGGGRKLLFPGLGERQAIFANHRLLLDTGVPGLAPGCQPGQLAGNPLAEDLEEINALLPPYRSIHGLLNSQGQLAALRFGRNYQDFLAVCREHDQHYRIPVRQQYDLVVASAGGYPKDINMIQAHKALHNAAMFVRDGGQLIVLAQCADGIGSATFLPYFEMGGPEQAYHHLQAHYSGNGGTALALMTKNQRIAISMVSGLPVNLCQRIGLKSVDYQTLAASLRQPGIRIAIIPNSSMVIGAS